MDPDRLSSAGAALRAVHIDADEESRGLVRLHAELLSYQGSALRLNVVGEAATAQTGYELTALLQPDVVLLDDALPDVRGFHLLRLLRRVVPAATLILLSEDTSARQDALRAGAHAWLSKRRPWDEVLLDVLAAASGHRSLGLSPA